MTWVMEVKVRVGTTNEWRKIHPTREEPYTFDTEDEARACLSKLYPNDVYGETVRVIELV